MKGTASVDSLTTTLPAQLRELVCALSEQWRGPLHDQVSDEMREQSELIARLHDQVQAAPEKAEHTANEPRCLTPIRLDVHDGNGCLAKVENLRRSGNKKRGTRTKDVLRALTAAACTFAPSTANV